MSELLSCPFCCGDDINIVRTKTIFDNRLGYLVLCADCGCTNGFNVDTEFTAFTDFDTEANAIDAWNMRAERTCRNVAPNPGCFECSVCGCDVSGGDELGANMFNGGWNYCPNCRAKVVSE